MAKSTSKRTDVSKGAFAADATVSERIGAALATLTPAHQRMAEYVLANPFRAATMRIDEFAPRWTCRLPRPTALRSRWALTAIRSSVPGCCAASKRRSRR